MKKYFFFYILLLLPIIGIAQTYKYIGVEDGLSNRRVYAIQKGPKGYMWFLTHDGIDRYNGKDFKPYKLMDGDEEVNSMMNLNWLYVDPKGTIWEIGKKGRVFRYDTKHDRFVLVYKLPESEVKGRPTPISYGFVDANSAQQRYVAAIEKLRSTQTSYDLIQEQFNLGMKNTVELLTEKNNLLNAQQETLQAKYMAILNTQLLKFYQGEQITL